MAPIHFTRRKLLRYIRILFVLLLIITLWPILIFTVKFIFSEYFKGKRITDICQQLFQSL